MGSTGAPTAQSLISLRGAGTGPPQPMQSQQQWLCCVRNSSLFSLNECPLFCVAQISTWYLLEILPHDCDGSGQANAHRGFSANERSKRMSVFNGKYMQKQGGDATGYRVKGRGGGLIEESFTLEQWSVNFISGRCASAISSPCDWLIRSGIACQESTHISCHFFAHSLLH